MKRFAEFFVSLVFLIVGFSGLAAVAVLSAREFGWWSIPMGAGAMFFAVCAWHVAADKGSP